MVEDLCHACPSCNQGEVNMDTGTSTIEAIAKTPKMIVPVSYCDMPAMAIILADCHTSVCREVSVQLIRTPTLDQLATEVAREKTCKTRTLTQHWVSDETRLAIAAGSVSNRCLECGLVLGEGAKGERKMRIHVRQHWSKYYCACGVGRDPQTLSPNTRKINSTLVGTAADRAVSMK